MAGHFPTELLRLGPARLNLRPAAPLAWEPDSRQATGPAGLALKLLERRLTAWQNVIDASGAPVRPGPAAIAALPAAGLEALLPGLCPPWLEPDLAAELEALAAHLRGRADFPGLDCAACREQETRGEGVPDCAACPAPPAPEAARPALLLAPLLDRLPGGAAAWLPVFIAGLGLEQRRRLGLRLAMIAGFLGPVPGAP